MPIPKEFLRKEKIRGILRIVNLKTDYLYLLKSEDIIESYKDERFKLDLGIHEAKELQQAYTNLGLELFSIEIDKEAKENESLDSLLEERKAYYLSKGNKLYS